MTVKNRRDVQPLEVILNALHPDGGVNYIIL